MEEEKQDRTAEEEAERDFDEWLDEMELDRIQEIVQSPELSDPLLFFLPEKRTGDRK